MVLTAEPSSSLCPWSCGAGAGAECPPPAVLAPPPPYSRRSPARRTVSSVATRPRRTLSSTHVGSGDHYLSPRLSSHRRRPRTRLQASAATAARRPAQVVTVALQSTPPPPPPLLPSLPAGPQRKPSARTATRRQFKERAVLQLPGIRARSRRCHSGRCDSVPTRVAISASLGTIGGKGI